MSDRPPATLQRRLGVWTSAVTVVGIIIGSGIFRVPGTVAGELGSVGAIALIWVLGGAITLCLAFSLAELSTLFPQPGGIYVYIRATYGPLPAFLFGWTFLLINPALWAGVAVVCAEYIGHFVPLSAGEQHATAVVMIGAVTWINYRSVRLAALVQSTASSAKALALVMLAAVIFTLGSAADGAFGQQVSFSVPDVGRFGVALVGVLFAYEGVASFCALAGEVRDPGRSLPRALTMGMIATTAIYLLVNAAYLYVLPVDALASSGHAASEAMARAAGPTAASMVAALVVLSTFACLTSTALADPRVLYAMAQDGLFFRSVGVIHPRFETPHAAVLASGLIAAVYASMRTFEQLAATFILGLWPFYALATAGVIVLRIRRPDLDRPYRTPGYPIVPIVFVCATTLVLANSLVEQPAITLANVAVTLLGIPVYFAWRWFGRRSQAQPDVSSRPA
jgi:APA family basic amino acid/polyamine antiporter